MGGSWRAVGETEGEQLAALGSSELFPFRLLITFAATTLVGIWSSCFAAACNTPYSARFSPRCIAHWARSARIPRKRGQLMGMRHYVSILRFAASSTGRAQLRNVAGQPGRARRAREDRKQQNGKEKEQSFGLFFSLVSGSYLQLILPYRSH